MTVYGLVDTRRHHEADHLRQAIEITEGIVHHWWLRELTSRLKPIYSGNARSYCHAVDV